MKKIAAITISRNDLFFLERWIGYYSKELGKENVYVFLDGKDQKLPTNSNLANITLLDHTPLSRTKGDKHRIKILSDFAAELFTEKKYDLVIGTDCDEFLVVDPHIDQSLKNYLSKIEVKSSVSALGLDVGQHLEEESVLNRENSILSQRSYAIVSSRYTKANIISKPLNWGSGFHRVRGKNFKIDKNLYLFHVGYCDLELMKDKSGSDKIAAGWEAHLKRRAKTIYDITNAKKVFGEKEIKSARNIQQNLRPFFAWNKPSMGWWNLVVKIPERFRNIKF